MPPLTGPRPAQDGIRDERPAAQRRADGFADILDVYLGCGASPVECGVKPHVTLSVTARDLAEHAGTGPVDLDGMDLDARWPFQLAWMGPISGAAARLLACDCDLSRVVLTDDGVPLNLGRTERLVTPALRRVLVIRHQGCAFTGCGRPAAWCQAHHLVFWSDGGTTDLPNLMLLCRFHHRHIHKGQWEAFIGDDGHPWFIPPAAIDPQRRPLPAWGRAGARAA